MLLPKNFTEIPEHVLMQDLHGKWCCSVGVMANFPHLSHTVLSLFGAVVEVEGCQGKELDLLIWNDLPVSQIGLPDP